MMMVHVSEELRLECQCDKFPTFWLPRVMEHAFKQTQQHKVNQNHRYRTKRDNDWIGVWCWNEELLKWTSFMSSLYSAESETQMFLRIHCK